MSKLPRIKVVRIAAVPMSFKYILQGQMPYLQSQGYDVSIISSPGAEIRWLEENEKVNVFPLEITREINIRKDLMTLIKLIILFAKIRPHIVHSHTPKAGLLAMIASFFAFVPIRLHTVTGIREETLQGGAKKIVSWCTGITIFFSNKIFAESFSVEEYLKTRFPMFSGKYTVIGQGSINGVDLDHFDFKIKDAGPVNPIKILFVGRLVKDKGIEELVAAFKKLTEEQSSTSFHLYLAGEFEASDAVSDIVKHDIEAHPQITKQGWVEDIRGLLATASFLVLPSYREGMPNVILQAGAMKVPVIASDATGCRDLIVDGKTGLSVPIGSTKVLFSAMKRLGNDPDLRLKLAEGMFLFIQEHYQTSDIQRLLADQYQDLLKHV